MTRQILLDTETTGLEAAKGHRIIEIGCLEMMNRKLTGRQFHTYLNPEREVDKGASAISGITTEFLLDKPKFHEVVDEFLTFIEGAELIIHNAPFDISFITAELAILQHDCSLDSHVRVFDTLALARQMHPGQKNNLDALCRRYGIDNSHRTYHGALLDAEILARVYLAMTAGQTNLALGLDNSVQDDSHEKRQQKVKLKRSAGIKLKVVLASAEDNLIHEARMSKLKAKALEN